MDVFMDMRWTLVAVAIFCTAGVAVPVAHAAASQSARTATSSTSVSAGSAASGPTDCNDSLYPYLPGMVDYCLAMRDWKSGSHQSGLELFKLAAGWGSKGAQYALGLIYYNGRHVTTDRARGIAWLKLAAERGNDAQAARVLKATIKFATPAQRQSAQVLFRKMRKRYGDKVAAKRAWRHLQHAKQRVQMSSLSVLGHDGCVVPSGSAGTFGGVGPPPVMGVGVKPGSEGAVANPMAKVHTGACVPIDTMNKTVGHVADVYFRGWRSKVTVGPLHQVPASASSSGH